MKKGQRYMRGIFLKILVQKRAKSVFFCTADIAENHNHVMHDSHKTGPSNFSWFRYLQTQNHKHVLVFYPSQI